MIYSKPTAIIIAGANGAGKTTFAREFLANEAECPTFLNADLIAAGISPIKPEAASNRAMKLLLQNMREHIAKRNNFAVETTLSGKSYLRNIPEWQKLGYHVKLIFLKLSTPEVAVHRVANRVNHGGHDVPENIIRRRFTQGWNNFIDYAKIQVNSWQVYNADTCPPVLIDKGNNDD